LIFVGLGSNLSSERYGNPQVICERAIDSLEALNIHVVQRSRWFRTAPVPVSDQPWFVNGVVAVTTDLDPAALLAALHDIEAEFGRIRRLRNEARVLDLDLLAYDDRVMAGPEGPILPHPRLQERAFVLLPLADLAPDWRHPRSGRSIESLIADLPPDQKAEPMPSG
jgi:2-amino-4-hydroxy-6-hydroxymethyldihydropteridine diphosphokinase